MRTPARYHAKDGKVYVVYHDAGKRVEHETGSALTANGRDLESFERALNVARTQRRDAGGTTR